MPAINATPTPRQLAYADAELGAFIHYDIEVFQPEWWEGFTKWSGGKGQRPARIELGRFNPRQLDTHAQSDATVGGKGGNGIPTGTLPSANGKG